MLADFDIYPTIPASDLGRARQFYEQKLGFTAATEAAGGVFYRSGSAEFLLFPSSGSASGAHTQAGWQVGDIEAEVAALRDRGVVFEEYDFPNLKTVNGIADTGPIRAAWFKDTEGNLLGIAQFQTE